MRKNPWFWAISFAVFIAGVAPAQAHGFGARYDLPLPLWLFLSSAGAAVALSFLVMALFPRMIVPRERAWRVDLTDTRLGRLLLHPWLMNLIKLISVSLFLLILASGMFGDPSPDRNFAPTMVWIIWWVGLAFVSALFGDFWAVINPWKILFTWAEVLYERIVPEESLSLELPYPKWLGAWPAVVLMLIFATMELVSESAELPRSLAALILQYSIITWIGMFSFGRDAWLRNGEVFTMIFGLIARFAPLEGRQGDAEEAKDSELCLRPYVVGLLNEKPVATPVMVFVILLLSTVTFDGFLQTSAWKTILDTLAPEGSWKMIPFALRARGITLVNLIQFLGLITFPALFLTVYIGFSRLTAWAGGGHVAGGVVARYFVLSLVPIAIAYHLAHYYSFLLINGQLIIPLASDPFGFGWDLFGTADYRVNIGIVTAKFVWYMAIAVIVLGHVVAVYLAHVTALRLFGHGRVAMVSQVPMLILMVGYTMSSLWILAQPLI